MNANPANAFVPHGFIRVEGAASGPLAGLTFAAKDLYDIAGHPTGFGNPKWLETHPVPAKSCPAVQRLLDAGATCIGKVITDELAYSMNGDNVHYGTPVNAGAPDRVPGGSSSGSAAAVSGRLCDFALGSDTGGSVRVPSSFCGTYGIRTTHGLVSLQGVAPLMPSYDTVGWLSLDATVMRRVGEVLLPPSGTVFKRAIVLEDAVALADPGVRPLVDRVTAAVGKRVGPVQGVTVAPDETLERWRLDYLNASAYEGWQVHGDWISKHRPAFGPSIKMRFDYAKSVSEADYRTAMANRAANRARIRALMGEDTVAILPSAAGPAPLKSASGAEVDQFRARIMRITAIAGHGGVPQVNLPFRNAEGLPVGVSLMGPAGSDLALLRLAEDLLVA